MSGGSSNPAATFCRACGDGLLLFDGETYCMQEGIICEALGPQNHRFCEHCGHADPGPGITSKF